MSELILSQPKECDRLEALRGEIKMVTDIAMQQRVGSTETKDAALTIGSQVKRMRKALDDRRKEITGPLQDTVKQIIAFANTLDAPLCLAEEHIRAQATAYARAIADEQRREQDKIMLEKLRAEADKEAQLKAAPVFSSSVQEELEEKQKIEEEAKQRRIELNVQERNLKAQGVKGTSEVWTYKIMDESLVPDEYWMLDESKIRNAVKVQKIRGIPGINIYSETQVSLRRF